MITKLRVIIGCVLVSLLLSACGSSPPVRYFSLSSTVVSDGNDEGGSVVLGVGPLRMAQYLDRSQMVTRGEGGELTVDEFNRWAEPLAVSFHRVIANDIDNKVGGVTVLSFPWQSAVWSQVDYRLMGDVIRFDADQSGSAVLEAQWGIVATESGEWPLPVRRTRYEVLTESPDDPAAVAQAMNQLLAQFSADIAGEMQRVLQE